MKFECRVQKIQIKNMREKENENNANSEILKEIGQILIKGIWEFVDY